MMTNQQKQRVMEMRVDGKTYREIAEETGVTLAAAKMFMSRYRNQKVRRRCVLCNKYLPKKCKINPTVLFRQAQNRVLEY